MAQLSYSAEGGTDEANVTTTPFGGDAFDIIHSTPPKYDTAQAAHGSVSIRSNAANPGWAGWDVPFVSSDDDYGRIYVRYQTLPPTSVVLLFWTVGGGNLTVTTLSDGKLRLKDAAGITDATAMGLSVDTWYRVEWHMVRHASAGSMELKIFTLDSTTVLETKTFSGRNTGSSAMVDFTFGNNDGTNRGELGWYDDIIAGATSYPGPAGSDWTPEQNSTAKLRIVTPTGRW